MSSQGGVSFPGTAVSLNTAMAVSLTSATLFFQVSGVSLLNIQVSLFSTAATAIGPPGIPQLVFNTHTGNQYVALLGSFI